MAHTFVGAGNESPDGDPAMNAKTNLFYVRRIDRA